MLQEIFPMREARYTEKLKKLSKIRKKFNHYNGAKARIIKYGGIKP